VARGLTTNGDGHISGLTMSAFQEFAPEALEDDERISGGDPLRRYTSLDEVPADAPTPFCKGNWDRNARPR